MQLLCISSNILHGLLLSLVLVLENAAMAGDIGRAAWNSMYERGLVDILHVYKDNAKYRGQNGWVSKGWKIITTKFNERFPAAQFTKQQIQEKEKDLKANYRALRDAKNESGSGWNESMCMIQVEPKVWDKLIAVSHLDSRKYAEK